MKNSFTYPFRRAFPIIICFCIFVLITRDGWAQVCSDPANIIYGLTAEGKIRAVHVATGKVDSAINPPLTGLGYIPQSNGMGYNPANGNFYYFEQEVNNPGTFVSYNPATNQTTPLSPMPYFAGVLSAAVNATGTGYYCLDAGYALFYYDIAGDSWTLIDSVMIDQNSTNVTPQFKTMYGGDMAIDGAGNLWMVIADDSSYALYVAAGPLPTTSVSQLTVRQMIPRTTLYEAGGSVDGIAFDPVGNIYLSTNSDLYELQFGTSIVTHIGSFNVDTTSDVMEDLTSCNFPGIGVLGLSFTNFTASLQPDRTALLDWQYSAAAGSGFSIERSPDGQHWSGIGSEAVAGTSPSSNYSWLDVNPFKGNNYYRIHLQDPGSAGSYSSIKMIDLSTAAAIAVSPNPVKDVLYIQYDGTRGSAKAVFYDPSGRTIMENALSAGSNSFNMGSLSAGLYIVSLQFAHGGNYIQKIVKR
jgi:hypothetical protein